MYESHDFTPKFTIVVDPDVINDFRQELRDKARGTLIFGGVNEVKNLSSNEFWVRLLSLSNFKFSTLLWKSLDPGASVVVSALQFAHFLGYRQFFIYGIDHQFIIDDILIEGKANSEGNHFIPNYRDGKRWVPPDFDRIEYAFNECNSFLLEDGCTFLNISRQSKLKCVKKLHFKDFVKDYL